MSTLDDIKTLRQRITEDVIGQDDVIEKILVALLTDGNVLLEGLPGLAKTRSVKSLAKHLDSKLSRIQFTPDLLPSDVTGTEIYQPEATEKFFFQPGPIFSNLVLADEINRAPAKVQSALLEAMEERQVSVAGKTHKMEPLFMVLATQNPIEQEGTYPLPEAQLDRFLLKLEINYPTVDNEMKIVQLVREESKGAANNEPALSQQVIFDARKAINDIKVSDAAARYIAEITNATRFPEKYSEELAKWVDYGASPRGSISLDKCSRAVAWLDGRDYVTPDDVRHMVHDVLRHRIILSYEANVARMGADKVIDELLKVVPVA
ncbi:MoxR-like ATPase [Chitinophaga jiangningensis]|uniref:MoxR-like ATPase n=1 Tax=Chitinophaga jiangningensis TaxID=1419482 RepID=A0A1M7LP94_9BACT|nr:MoxR family ATPase [Chitinophaga jiangningensis]SHM79459.1 MoxR-like ATPase [Chitinophaga jiangningensis]